MTSDKKANIFRTTAWQLLCKQAWYKQDLQIYVPLVTKSNNIVRIQLTEWLDHAHKNSQGSSCQTFQKEKLTSHLHGSVLIDMKNLMKMQHSVGEETKVARVPERCEIDQNEKRSLGLAILQPMWYLSENCISIQFAVVHFPT